jgi:hypothetical protein
MMTIRYSLLLALLLPLSVFSQTAQWLNFTNGDHINDLEFENNYAWIATSGGLVRYDTLSGESFFFNKSNSGLLFNELRSLVITPDGKKWLAARIGLISYDGAEWELHAPPNAWDNPIDQFSVLELATDADGYLWMITEAGNFFKYDGFGQWTEIDVDTPAGSDINSLFIDKNGYIWLYGWGNDEFYRFDGTTMTVFNETNTPFPPDFSVGYITPDPNGNIWVNLNFEDDIFRYDGSTWTPLTSQQNFWISGAFCVGTEGSVYFVDYNGLNRLNPDGTLAAENLPQEAAFAANDIYSPNRITFDAGGKIWLATNSGLFAGHAPAYLSRIKTTNSALGQNGIESVSLVSPQDVLITWSEQYYPNHWSNAEGITTCKNGAWQRHQSNTAVGTPDFSSITKGDSGAGGFHWLSSYNTLYRFDGDTWAGFDNPFDAEAFFGSFAADPLVPNKVWARTWNKLYKLENGVFEKFDLPFDYDYWYDHLAVDSEGGLWTAPSNNIHNKIWRFKDGAWNSFDTTAMGLSHFSAWVADIETGPGGKVGIVTDAGVAVYDGAGNWTAWHYQNTGVTSLYRLNAIAFDGPDVVWLGYFHEGCNAPSLNAGPSLTRIEGNVWTNYYFLSSGMPHPNVSDLAVDAYHNLWIGTDYGGLGILNVNNIILSAENTSGATPRQVVQVDVAPNPAMQQTTLRFSLPEKTDLSVQITDAAGRVVESWLDHDVPAGPFSFVWDVKEHPAGMYYFVVSSGQGRFAGNIMVQK